MADQLPLVVDGCENLACDAVSAPGEFLFHRSGVDALQKAEPECPVHCVEGTNDRLGDWRLDELVLLRGHPPKFAPVRQVRVTVCNPAVTGATQIAVHDPGSNSQRRTCPGRNFRE